MKKFLILIITIMLLTPALAIAAPQDKKIGYVGITYETKDSFVLKAKLFYPKEKKASYPLVVFLHSLGYSSEYWGGLTKDFIDAGAAVLVMDLRGHGQSIYDSNFKIRSWVYYTDRNYAKYPNDVVDVLKYVMSTYKNVSATKYAIVGSDIGANAAILAAEKMDQKPSCMALISPSRNFKGLYTPVSLTNAGTKPILNIVSAKDRYSVNEANVLTKFAQGPYEIKQYPAGGMGMLMLKVNPTMADDIVGWVMPNFEDKTHEKAAEQSVKSSEKQQKKT